MLNRVVLIGRLATDPELKYSGSGMAIANFRIAVDRRPNAQGERETDFIPIVAFKQSAEFAGNYLAKGRLVSVDGRMQVRSWVAQDGTRRYVTEVIAESLRGLDRPKDQTGVEPGPADEAVPEPAHEESEVAADQELEDPFDEE